MFKQIYADLLSDLKALRMLIYVLIGNTKLLISMLAADLKHKKHFAIERKKYKDKAYDMNFNVMLFAKFNPKDKTYSNQLCIADNNEVIMLARKLRWLPKRMTAHIMQKRNSVFYTTNPKMSKLDSFKLYSKFLKAEFQYKEAIKNKANTTVNANSVK